MASKLALRTLGAIALPGALLTMAAPAASAVELAPLSHVNAQGTSTDTSSTQASDAGSAHGTSGLLNGRTIGL